MIIITLLALICLYATWRGFWVVASQAEPNYNLMSLMMVAFILEAWVLGSALDKVLP